MQSSEAQVAKLREELATLTAQLNEYVPLSLSCHFFFSCVVAAVFWQIV